MQNDYISTDALHGLDYLSHARVYAHKYIRREPDGHGGYRYYYPTDIGQNSMNRSRTRELIPSSNVHNTSYSRETTPSGSMLTAMRNRNVYGGINDINFAVGTGAKDLARYYRQADKAGQIYKEGLAENKALDANVTPKPNIAQQAISTITTAAKSTYEAGMNFLKKLFSTPIITTKKNIDVHVVGNMR